MADYATLEEYKFWVSSRGLQGDVTSDPSDDESIKDILTAVSRYFDYQTGRRFYPDSADGTYYYQAKDAYTIDLPDFSSITSVSVDFENTRSYTTLTVSTDYDIVPDNYAAEGIPINGLKLSPLTSYSGFPLQRKNIKIVGKRGWSTCPGDIKVAVLATAHNINGERSGQTSAGNITVTAAGIVVRPQNVPAFAQEIIKNYRNPL